MTHPGDSRSAQWPHVLNMAMALWLLASPPTLAHGSSSLTISTYTSAVLIIVLSWVALRKSWAAWATAAVGGWVMTAPLLFHAPTAAAYNNGTLIGALVATFAVVIPRVARDEPGEVPPGWTYNPSSWEQRLPIVFLAMLGFFSSRYMAAYQLGHLDSVWDPFFGDGTHRVLTSEISKAFIVSDAGLGALSYLIDAIAGTLGGRRRWRTMPWIVIVFGIFIIPPGVTSIVLVILQPIGVGAWCTLCLITAVIMLMMVPPAIDEVIATCQFLMRTRREGKSFWRAFWKGEGSEKTSDVEPKPRATLAGMVHGVEVLSMPWNLVASAAIGAWLMAAPAVLGLSGAASNHIHIAGALVATNAVIAGAEPTRLLRYLNIPCALWVISVPFITAGAGHAVIALAASGIVLILLSFRCGKVEDHYGSWDRVVR